MNPPSKRAEDLINLAHKWTLANDSLLLDWMKEIGKNLEEHANTTIDKLASLSVDVRNACTALDNANNSLSILQHTQFIENRCLEDDENVPNTVEAVDMNRPDENDTSEMSDENFEEIFLKANLDAFRNCHDRELIKPRDSDRDNTENYIYIPKNPYNEQPLPYIYGSKPWKEHWHVGILKDNNPSRETTISKGISEATSSCDETNAIQDKLQTTVNDNPIIGKAGSTSLKLSANEHKLKLDIPQEISSSILSQKVHPVIPSREYSKELPASGVTGSTTPSGISVNSKQNENQNLFSPIPDTPSPLPSSSSAASLVQKSLLSPPPPPPIESQVKQPVQNQKRSENIKQLHSQDKSVENTRGISIQPDTSQNRYRPVNLFDDDDFNSFLTDIAAKKEEPSNHKTLPVAAARSTVPVNVAIKTDEAFSAHKQSPKPQEINIITNNNISSMVDDRAQNMPRNDSISNEPSVSRKKPANALNLFDKSDFNPIKGDDDNLFSQYEKNSNKFEKISSASNELSTTDLFGDDDDDDFLNMFKSKIRTPANFTRTISLFDDDDDDESSAVEKVAKSTEIVNREELADKNESFLGKKPDLQLNKKSHRKVLENEVKSEIDLFAGIKDEKEEGGEKPISIVKNQYDNDDLFHNLILRTNRESTSKFDGNDEEDESKKGRNGGNNKNFTNVINEQNTTDRKIVAENSGREGKYQVGPEKHSDIISQSIDVSNISQTKVDLSTNNDLQIKLTSHSNDEELVGSADPILNHEIGNFPSVQKNIPINKYSGLFLEAEPPENDNFFEGLDKNILEKSILRNIESDFYHDPPHVEDQGGEAASKVFSSNNYGNFGLYDELPPPDYGDDEHGDVNAFTNVNQTSDSKRSIFYDDFDETMAAVNKSKSLVTAKNLHSIFDDEPPVDDDFQSIFHENVKIQDEPISGLGEIDTGNKNNISKVDENEFEPTKISRELTKSFEKVEISKLDKTKLNINVESLLPSTHIPKIPKSSGSLTEAATPERVSEEKANFSASFANTESPTNILVNMCKNRVRILAKRRPSTRRARQENYRKSLLAEEEEEKKSKMERDENSWQNLFDKQSSEFDCPLKTESENVNVLMEEENAKEFSAPKAIVTRDTLFADTERIEEQNVEISEDFNISKSETPNFSKTTKELDIVEASKNQVTTNLFDDDDDDLFSTTKKSNELENARKTFDDIVPKPTISIRGTNAETQSTTPDSLGSLTKSHTSKSDGRNFAQSANIFDDDNDDDDLFSGKPLKITKPVTRSIVGTVDTIESSTTSKMPQVAIGVSDALNNKTIETKESVRDKAKSLFGSDDDEDYLNDNKYTSASLNKHVKSLKPEAKRQITSLFDDDDDDDDLFSGKASKAAPKASNRVNTEQTNKFESTTRKITKSITDDPLADLLNN